MSGSPRALSLSCLVPLLFGFGLFPKSAAATNYLITTTVDDTTVNGNCTLREAIRSADANSVHDACPAGGAADVITLQATGTYPFLGGETLTGSGTLTVQSQTLNPFSASIDLGGAGRFLWLSGGGSYVLGGLEIKNGVAPDESGGAVRADSVALRIFNFRFVDNHADRFGGALYFAAFAPGQNLALSSGTFSSNDVGPSLVGGVGGGAAQVEVDGDADADLRDVLFSGNSASTFAPFFGEGGGLDLETSSATSRGMCARCIFQNNSVVFTSGASSFRADGGGIYVAAANGSRIDLADGRFTGNAATAPSSQWNASAVSGVATAGAKLVADRIFIDSGGGNLDGKTSDIFLKSAGLSSSISLVESQSTFGVDSGLRAETDAGSILLGHLTIADYSSSGAILIAGGAGGGPIQLENSILALNGTNLSAFGLVNQTTNFVGGNPLFLNEPIGDYHLSAASTAIGAGTNNATSMRLADLDHHGRIVGAATDIGCYEFNGLFADDFEVGDAGSWSALAP